MAKIFISRTVQVTHKWTWWQLTSIDGNMLITIPFPFTYTGHNVQLVSGHHKLWFPNCSAILSFPGICPQGLALLDYFGYRLLDGSLSCFNPVFYPQVLSNLNPHYTFFLQPPCSLDAPAIAENCPKWTYLTTYWIQDVCNIGTGHVHRHLLGDLRWWCTQIKHLHLVQCQHFLPAVHHNLNEQRLSLLPKQWECQMF